MSILKHQVIRAVVAMAAACLAVTAQAKPAGAVGHINKGVEFAQQKQYDQAIAEFNAAIQADPKSAVAYDLRGTVYRSQQKFPEAMADFAKAIEVAPADERGYFERGQTALMQKQFADALTDLNKAVELKPDDVNAVRIAAAPLEKCCSVGPPISERPKRLSYACCRSP